MAEKLFKEAGYNGEPITILHATDHAYINPANLVMIQQLRKAEVPQPRRPGDGLGLGGLAPRQEGAAGSGRLEHLHLGHDGADFVQPGHAHLDRHGLRQRPGSAGRATRSSRSCASDWAFAPDLATRKKLARGAVQAGLRSGALHLRSRNGAIRSPIARIDSPGCRSCRRFRRCGTSRRSTRLLSPHADDRLHHPAAARDDPGHGRRGAVRFPPAASRARRPGGRHRRRRSRAGRHRRHSPQARPRPAAVAAVRRLRLEPAARRSGNLDLLQSPGPDAGPAAAGADDRAGPLDACWSPSPSRSRWACSRPGRWARRSTGWSWGSRSSALPCRCS